MYDYYLTSDVTIDLKPEMIAELGIEVIPMHYYLGNNEYVHSAANTGIPLEEFYQRLRDGEDASTSQINPSDYETFFEPFLAEGKDIIHISLSSGLSGTCSSAGIAVDELMEKYPDRKITIIDSICASVGEGFLAILAADRKKAGASYDELVTYIQTVKSQVCHWFMVENLEQLKKGGRISALEAGLGQALHICPVLTTDREGKLTVAKKVRGEKKAVSVILDQLRGSAFKDSNGKVPMIAVAHAANLECAEKVKKEIIEEGICDKVFMCEIGPVIGSHVGPGMFAIIFLGENYITV